MVALDAGFLGLILHPGARPPDDPLTKQAILRLPERIRKLEEDWLVSRERILIPTPALAEFLVLAGEDGNAFLQEINFRSNFYLQPFDVRAAVEIAAMEVQARKTGSKRAPASISSPWQKVKVDRQMVAVAKVNQATTIYSDDVDVRNIAEDVGIRTVSCWQLDLPTSDTPLFDINANPIDMG